MRDAEQPAPKFLIVAQVADVFDGRDERFLHQVEARLLVMHQFKDIDIRRQLVAPKESVPSRRFSGPGLQHGQMFALSHYQHLHREECDTREKVQWVPAKTRQSARRIDFSHKIAKNWPVFCYLVAK